MRNGATSHNATQRWPCLTASVMSDRPRPPEPIRPRLNFSLAPRTLTAGTANAAVAAAPLRNVRRETFIVCPPVEWDAPHQTRNAHRLQPVGVHFFATGVYRSVTR